MCKDNSWIHGKMSATFFYFIHVFLRFFAVYFNFHLNVYDMYAEKWLWLCVRAEWQRVVLFRDECTEQLEACVAYRRAPVNTLRARSRILSLLHTARLQWAGPSAWRIAIVHCTKWSNGGLRTATWRRVTLWGPTTSRDGANKIVGAEGVWGWNPHISGYYWGRGIFAKL